MSLPSTIDHMIRYKYDEAYLEKRKQLLENMTAEKVNAAIQKYIKPLDQWIRVSVGEIKS